MVPGGTRSRASYWNGANGNIHEDFAERNRELTRFPAERDLRCDITAPPSAVIGD
jgi:hypothetical protein